jgi:tripartite-type tricarboxylate transporter receptor subunit TctC
MLPADVRGTNDTMTNSAQAWPRRGVLATGLALPALARAQSREWPSGPVRFITLWAAGGGSDVMARLYCTKLSELAGQQFIVENRAGAAGNLGTEMIAKAPPDGSVIGLGNVAPLALASSLYPSLPFNPRQDFTLVGGIWQMPNLLIINKDLPVNSVPELIAFLRANPGKYAYASPGSGTTNHLSAEMLKRAAGLDILHVPYRGGAPAHVDLLAGRVHMIFDAIPGGLPAAREGRVKALAVTSAQRSAAAPDIPTMAEFLPGFEITSWSGVVAPAGLPQPIVEKLAALTRQALQSPDLIAKFADYGASPWIVDTPTFARFRASEEQRFAELIRAAGARVD